MTRNEQTPRHTGKLTAGLLAALLAAAMLAGCGGGGGGGGGGSSSGGGSGGSNTETTVVSPQAVTAAGATVGTVATNGVQVEYSRQLPTLNAAAPPYNIGIYSVPSGNPPTTPAGDNGASAVL